MALRFALVLLLSVYTFNFGLAIPAFPVEKCGPNAEFKSCGSACAPDCAHPKPRPCPLYCVSGCFCKDGFMKNANGECVRLLECETPIHKLPMQIPQAAPQAAPQCPANEEFKPCGTACPATCSNPHPSPVCTRNCVIGCFCKEGYLRNAQGTCVETRACEAAAQPNMLFAYPPEVSQCKDNEIFMPCGSACAPTCANPHPAPYCTMQCIVGCFCKPGYLKNEQGVCVASTNCGVRPEDAIAMPAKVCAGDNEEFRQCKGCDGTCKNPNPMCPRICIPGCACKEGHVRSETGKCVETRECAAQVQPESFMKCPHNEEFRPCGTACPATCLNPNPSPVCTRNCVIGCFCKEGYLRNAQGTCVETRACEAAAQPNMLFAYPPEVSQCKDNEEYRECKGCDGTCKNPNPICPMICIDGCACKEGHVRSETGKCIETRECAAQVQPESFKKCPINEEYRPCGTACPATCSNPNPSPVCTRNCIIGCFCKAGYLRNEQGVCVAADNCVAPAPMVLAETSVKAVEGKCATDREIYADCGNQMDCMASCGSPLPFLIHGYPQVPPKCLERSCTPGCVCMRPYVRNTSGMCVERSECEHKNPFATTPSH